MDVPGTENSETVPTNWLWVKAGLLSFWSSTTISMVVGFSSLSPLGDSAKAFSYKQKDTAHKCLLTRTEFMKSMVLTVKYHKIPQTSYISWGKHPAGHSRWRWMWVFVLHAPNTCWKWQKEMCRMFGSTWVTSQSSGLKHFEVSPKMPIKVFENWPLAVCANV